MNQSRNIRIKLENYQDLSRQFPYPLLLSTIIFAQCKFLGRILKETGRVLLTPVDIIEANEEIDLEFYYHDLQSLISTPVTLIIFQEGVEHGTEDLRPSKEIKRDILGRKMKEVCTQTENNYYIFGSCLIDLMPVLFGEQNYKQFVGIDLVEKYDKGSQPGVNIEITIDNPLQFPIEPNLLTLTIESIFNLTQDMSEELEYQIYVKFPFSSNPTIFKNTAYKQARIVRDYKKWLNFDEPDVKNTIQYKINPDVTNIRNDVNVDLAKIFKSKSPRIEFNSLQRYFLLYDDFLKFIDYIDNISSLYLEIFCISSDGVNNLHLMAIIDLSSLLNSETTNIRVATPVYSFDEEIFKRCLNYDEPQYQQQDKKCNSDENSLINSSVESLELTTSEDWRMKRIIFNDNGEPTFIIIEIDLLHPVGTQKIDNLFNDSELKLISENCKQQLINETLKAIIDETIRKYGEYLEQRKRCICSEKSDFLTYLQRTGYHQCFLHVLTQLIVLIVQNSDNSHQVIEQISEEFFCEILKEFNLILNEDNSNILNKSSQIYNDLIVLHTQEAIALQYNKLANKYLLQNIVLNDNNPDSWVYYSAHQMLCGEIEKAYTSVQEALNLNNNHCLSLVLNGILLCHKNQKEEAESCFSLLVENVPECVEGWGVLYLFHNRNGNYDSLELCKENGEKYLENYPIKTDFLESYKMIWTRINVPNTFFLRTALLLIDLKIFNWAEEALSLQTGYCDIVYYLLGVNSYYDREYSKALENLEKCKQLSESVNDAVLSLIGHCHYRLESYEEALNYYNSVLELEENSINLHLIYMNLAKIYKIIDDFPKAREYLLLACKLQPTVQTWSALGKLYYSQNDFISAEECFSEALMYDNHLSATWSYLSLVNWKMCRLQEAEVYQQIATMVIFLYIFF